MGGQDIYYLACEVWWDPERKNCSPENPTGRPDGDIGAPPTVVGGVAFVGLLDGAIRAYMIDRASTFLTSVCRGMCCCRSKFRGASVNERLTAARIALPAAVAFVVEIREYATVPLFESASRI